MCFFADDVIYDIVTVRSIISNRPIKMGTLRRKRCTRITRANRTQRVFFSFNIYTSFFSSHHQYSIEMKFKNREKKLERKKTGILSLYIS